ncbi:hypothetical protein CC2G_006788 [Coprinopsis cinerea AmutBmut pab1-1]|nr:hypothetical protein CC2G_006788 [Coprinopsis cinerea AmutBmut pab1-1]
MPPKGYSKRHVCERDDPVKSFRVKIHRKGPGTPKLILVPDKNRTPSSKRSGGSRSKSESKRRKMAHLGDLLMDTSPTDDWVDEDLFIPFDVAQLETKTVNSPNDYMRYWLEHKQTLYLDEIVSGEFCDLVCAVCGADKGDIWRCKDCLGRPALCGSCCRTQHWSNPFHRVEIWKGEHFSPSWLWKTGLQVSLCPNRLCSSMATEGSSPPPSTSGSDDDCTFGAKPEGSHLGDSKTLVVVHTNGIHQIPFVFCDCENSPDDDIQLLRMGFYPATQKDVRTVFTFSVMDTYLLENLECYTSAFHFYSKLRRLTNEVFPKQAPNRYREGLRCGRQWRKLKEMKRYGLAHTQATPQEGGMALFCAACPQPGKNLPEGWEEDEEQWKYGITLAADGNFSLLHREQKNADDVWFKNGEGYLVERTRYEKHLRVTSEEKEIPTCHEHRAVEDKSKTTKGCDVTGVGAFACSRHGCFVPASVVNFHRGERQMYMDYGLSNSIKTTSADKMKRLILLYDINCQYCRNLKKRFEAGPYLTLPSDLVVTFGIGQFHVHGHQEKCYARYSPMFIKGIGYTSGEILEALWSVLNEASRPTQTMSLAHRTEVLDAFIADSNWKKMLNLMVSIPAMFARSVREIAKAREAFELLDQTASSSQRAIWQHALDKAHSKRVHDVEEMDILNVSLDKPPSRAKVQHKLMVKEQNQNTGVGVTSWLTTGFKIQESQLQLKAFRRSLPRESLRTATQELELAKKREALHSEISSFCTSTQILFPDVNLDQYRYLNPPEITADIDDEDQDCESILLEDDEDNPFTDVPDPEDLDIPLPSSFDRLPALMKSASRKEIKLRVAQANDALEAIRTEIGHKSYLYRSNIRLADGKKQKTRGYAAVKAANQAIRLSIRVYEQARWALQRLGATTDTLARFKPIVKEDTRAITAIYRPNEPGQTKSRLSWIWGVDVQGDSSNSPYLEELEDRALFLTPSQLSTLESQIQRFLDCVDAELEAQDRETERISALNGLVDSSWLPHEIDGGCDQRDYADDRL